MTAPRTPTPSARPPAPHRSEGLLPADDDDERFDIAEEVAFDLQSDSTRRVGAMPADGGPGKPAGAVAESLAPGEKDPGKAPLAEALDRAVPRSP